MATETTIVWIGWFDADENVRVESYPAKVTAKVARVDKGGTTFTYDKERVHDSREEALAYLRARVESDLAFLHEKRMEANKQLYALKKYEDELFLADRPSIE